MRSQGGILGPFLPALLVHARPLFPATVKLTLCFLSPFDILVIDNIYNFGVLIIFKNAHPWTEQLFVWAKARKLLLHGMHRFVRNIITPMQQRTPLHLCLTGSAGRYDAGGSEEGADGAGLKECQSRHRGQGGWSQVRLRRTISTNILRKPWFYCNARANLRHAVSAFAARDLFGEYPTKEK